MNYSIIIKKGGEIIKEPFTPNPKTPYAYNYQQTKPKHLCFGCKNGYPSKCPKIFDRFIMDNIEYNKIDTYNKTYEDYEMNKIIENYPFIREGFQIINEKGITQSLIVSNCTLYEKSAESIYAKESKKTDNSHNNESKYYNTKPYKKSRIKAISKILE